MCIDLLKQYDDLKDEQKQTKKTIERLERELAMIIMEPVTDSVKGTRADGTYGSIKITGIAYPELDKKRKQLQHRIDVEHDIESQIEELIVKIEEQITSINDSEVRKLVRLRYIEGKSWRAIGRSYGKSPSWGFMRIQRYFSKNSNNTVDV